MKLCAILIKIFFDHVMKNLFLDPWDPDLLIDVDFNVRLIWHIVGAKKHVIMLDADSKDSSIGMSGPPQAFLESDFLEAIHNILDAKGMYSRKHTTLSMHWTSYSYRQSYTL